MPRRPHTIHRVLALTTFALALGAGASTTAQSPAPGAAGSQIDVEVLYDHFVGQAADGFDLSALPAVYAVDEIEDYIDADRVLADRRRLAADRGLHPTVRAHLAQKLAVTLMHRGDHAGADAVVEGAGFLTRFSICGPFAGDAAAIEQPLPPEARIEGDDTWNEGDHALTWQRADRADFAGYLDVSAWAHPARGATAFAATTVVADANTRAVLWLGVAGAYRVWVNGELVGAASASGPAHPDQIGWPIALQAGANVVVFKLAAPTNSASLGLYSRLTDTRGRPLEYTTTPRVAPSPALAPRGRLQPLTSPARDVAQMASRLSLRGPDPIAAAERRFLAGYLLERTHPRDVQRPWRPLFEQAARAVRDRQAQLVAIARAEERNDLTSDAVDLGTAGMSPLLAAAASTQSGERLAFAELARSGAGARPWAQTWALRAQLEGRGAGRLPMILDALRDLTRDYPDYWPAALLQAELDPAFGFPQAGLARIRDLARAHPRTPVAWSSYLRALRSAGNEQEEMKALEVWLGFRAADGASRARLAELLRKYRRPGDAAALLAAGRSLAPEAVGLTRLHASALADANRVVEAAALLERLGQRRPRDRGLLLARAQLEDLRRNPGEATQLLERALALAPHDEALRARISHRLGHAPTPELAWLLPSNDPRLAACGARCAHSGSRATTLVHQRIVHRTQDGRQTVVGQRVMEAHTPAGVTRAATLDIPYTPGREIVEVVRARRVRLRGGSVEGFKREDRGSRGATRGVYRRRTATRITVPFVEPGDVVEIAWRVTAVRRPAPGAEAFSDLHFLNARDARRWSRYVVTGVAAPHRVVVHPPGRQPPATVVEERGEALVVEWTDAAAVELEPNPPGQTVLSSYLHVSDTRNWNALASAYWNLVKGQIIVTDEVRRTAEQAARGARSPQEIARALYTWVARQHRYVGLDFGDHSYLPYPTPQTLARGFGDCKDKATLLKAMLSVHGIDSHLVLVRTRARGPVDPTVASLRPFDHVILWIPTIDRYVDATATWTGTETLPSRLQGASALVIEDGVAARFLQLPRAPASANLLSRNVVADVRTGAARVEIRATGNYAAGYRAVTAADPTAALQARFGDEFGLEITKMGTSGEENLDAAFRARFNAAGARGWLEPHGHEGGGLAFSLPSSLAATWAPAPGRAAPVEIPFAFTVATRLQVRLPRGVRADLRRFDRAEATDLGAFERRASQRGDTLTIEFRYSLHRLSITPGSYERFRAFLERIDSALDGRIRLEGLR